MSSELFEIMIFIQNGHISFSMRSQGEFEITPIMGLLPMVLHCYLWFCKKLTEGKESIIFESHLMK